MTKIEIIRRLHLMVDQLETVPGEWFEEGVCPLLKVTFVRKRDEERFTLVVGVTNEDGE